MVKIFRAMLALFIMMLALSIPANAARRLVVFENQTAAG